MPRALLSVSDKTGLIPFAQALAGRGYELVSTGGTARALENAGVPVTGISQVTGFPEIMDGRVKTLHPAVHGGILARRGRSDDMATLGQHNITPIDIVVVNLYPVCEGRGDARHRVWRARRGDRYRRAQHGALGREEFSGCAGRRRSRRTIRACSPSSSGPVVRRSAFRFDLARKAFAHTAAYDAAIAGTLAEFARRRGKRHAHRPDIGHPAAAVADAPQDQRAALRRKSASAGGVVCHGQRLRPRVGAGAAGQGAVVHQSARPRFGRAHRARIHRAGGGRHQAHESMRSGDRPLDRRGVRSRARGRQLAAFGGIIGLNRPIDAAAARALVSTFIEAVIAPAVEDEARPILAAKANMRVVVADLTTGDDAASRRDVRSILGAMLVQQRDEVTGGAFAVECADVRGRRAEGRHEARAERGGMGRAPFRLAYLRARQIERRDLYRRVAHAGDRRGPDEPRRCRAGRGHEGGELRWKEPAGRIGRRLGCIFSVPRRIGRPCESGRDGRRSAGRVVARQRSHRGRRRTRHRDGVHGEATLQTLTSG